MFHALQKSNFIALDAKASHVHKGHCQKKLLGSKVPKMNNFTTIET